ncbi:MAG: outer membrane beta-barrel protein [Candidatus Aminicenantes bacterium]|nr:outer membrane beta-barrel protein [Candidatus Aminicenantes bacterium]NIM78613.1 outer membrane beta-barrel protein [Candidatus Aminicenantes bacterium]NIN17858.1 outer membrane beta-barrel protein [Candidatus Aminicenantes bacterium]NIN41762.1 outer membrane beta-barrel protein [Candidatus Aminicenantes bacterium]NIN84511.1 outer membrane beta-barrel protein [Candidatus Aminicenantes bacterium]
MKMICTPKRKSVRLQYIWLFTFLLLIASIAFAQGSGKSKRAQLYEKFRGIAKEMEEAYDNGDLKRVIDLYNKYCRKDKNARAGEEKKEFKKVKKEIRTNIYQCVALSYNELDNPEIADIYIRRLLVLRRREDTGDYWWSLRDTAKDKYYVAPRLLVGVKLGTNFTIAKSFNSYSIFEPVYETGEDNYEKKYDFHFNHSRGTQLGIIVEYALSKNLSIYIQPVLSMLKFQYKDSQYIEHSVQMEENNLDSFTRDSTSRQTLHYIEIPLLLKYQLGRAKLKPYLQIGGFLSIMRSAYKMMSIKITEVIGQYQGSSTTLIEDIPIKDHITRSRSGFCLGAGIDYDAGDLRLGIEINYKHLLGNIVNKDHRFDKDILLGYYDVFDDITIRNVEISLKVLLPISFKAFRR